MITLKDFIDKIRDKYVESVSINFDFPVFYIIIENDAFSFIDEDYAKNLDLLAESLSNDNGKVEVEDITSCLNRNSCNLIFNNIESFKHDYSFVDSRVKTHWLSMYDDFIDKELSDSSDVRAIHFYGNKGGQARSSFLATFSKYLQSKGLKVLVVDVDIEAPTLHLNLGIKEVPIEASLLSYCEEIGVEHRVIPSPEIPNVDLISCRPTDDKWDADYISFCLKSATMPSLLNNGINTIRNKIKNNESGFDHDIVLFDHRTGAAHSVIPVLSAWPGSCLIFTRPDNQTNWLTGISKLLEFFPENPGAFISFDLDYKSSDKISPSEDIQREKLLSLLSISLSKDDDDEGFTPEELESYYIKWVYDRSYLGNLSPGIEDLQRANALALKNVYDLLDISKPKSRIIAQQNEAIKQSISGVRDETWFVESNNSKLTLNRDGNVTYILGRKGTGKSRLFEQSIIQRVGIPLLAPSEYEEKRPGILTSANMYLSRLVDLFIDDYQGFWWFLIYSRIKHSDSDENYLDFISKSSYLNIEELKKCSDPISVSKILNSNTVQVLLIDGLETINGLKASKVKSFVSSLINCISVIHSNPELSRSIKIKLFARMDLVFSQTQNIEQQMEGKSVDLTWGEDSQLNFNLACIAGNECFKNKFPDFHSDLISNKHFITSSMLSISDCEDMLLRIFPDKLRRSNLKTTTFLKTYFRDASSASSEHKATFYPRLFLNFINELGNSLKYDNNIVNGKISHSIIDLAYENAASSFLRDIRQELIFAIEFNDDYDKNVRMIESLLQHFNGRVTPFDLTEEIDEIFSSLDEQVSKNAISVAMNTMKNMGIFEPTASDVSKWRAGRVYKSALKMKFLRKKKF
ncbi:hypothetical protein FNO25_002962 [Vibrio fluvialis]|uniref:MinD/ParA family ATP-binding protein n=1 Tax=Vibrio fluvialis TaxID=676 RepID=UPI0015592736|nr:hypothetical protein [Vibrio fluvialis]EKO3405928.1 hypothetical protein [Vibrio fluvialis]EKO3953686.1 hypothetical protein [Vibrio fluvialis]EKO3974967.1 hypothetical protein [Vibrio fluvialis]EKO4001419.1 hypothetical protein [Vibrio fluvialis]ELG2044071.1 hypothetical protein [Vibrio fluvialis]